MNKKKVIICLIIFNLLIIGVGSTYSAYRSSGNGNTSNFSYAKMIFNNEETTQISIDSSGIKPGETQSYTFKVSNNKSGVKSDVNIGYKIIIQTFHLMPTTIYLYDTNNNNKNLIMTCNGNNNRNTEHKIECISSEYVLNYSSNVTNNYEIDVLFNSTDANGETWEKEYSELIDFIDIKIDSYQKTN